MPINRSSTSIGTQTVILSRFSSRVSRCMTGPDTRTTQLYIVMGDRSRQDKDGFAPIGKVIAGASVLEKLTKDDAIRNIIIRRIGKAATDFKTDTDSFQKLLAEKAKILAPVKAPAKKK